MMTTNKYINSARIARLLVVPGPLLCKPKSRCVMVDRLILVSGRPLWGGTQINGTAGLWMNKWQRKDHHWKCSAANYTESRSFNLSTWTGFQLYWWEVSWRGRHTNLYAEDDNKATASQPLDKMIDGRGINYITLWWWIGLMHAPCRVNPQNLIKSSSVWWSHIVCRSTIVVK